MLGTVVIATAVAVGLALLPELLFLWGVAIVDVDPTRVDEGALRESATTVRLALTQQYFNWAVINITICGALFLRASPHRMSGYTQSLVAAAFLSSGLSIIVGSSFLEFISEGMALGLPMPGTDSFLHYYPSLQFLSVVCGFLLVSVATVLSLFGRRAGDFVRNETFS